MDVLLTAAVVDDPEKLVTKLLQKKKKKDTSSGATFQRQVHAQKLSKQWRTKFYLFTLVSFSLWVTIWPPLSVSAKEYAFNDKKPAKKRSTAIANINELALNHDGRFSGARKKARRYA